MSPVYGLVVPVDASMKNFVLGVSVGIAIAVCGYKPYQIETEYRHNIAAGVGLQAKGQVPLCPCFNGVVRIDKLQVTTCKSIV